MADKEAKLAAVKHLIEKGADVGAGNVGDTVLDAAIEYGFDMAPIIIKEVLAYQKAANNKFSGKQDALANAIKAENSNFTIERLKAPSFMEGIIGAHSFNFFLHFGCTTCKI